MVIKNLGLSEIIRAMRLTRRDTWSAHRSDGARAVYDHGELSLRGENVNVHGTAGMVDVPYLWLLDNNWQLVME